jgi:hypothetical protein
MFVPRKRLDRPTLIAIGKRLRAQYEANAAPRMSAELVAAVAKFETILREKADSVVFGLPRRKPTRARSTASSVSRARFSL